MLRGAFALKPMTRGALLSKNRFASERLGGGFACRPECPGQHQAQGEPDHENERDGE